MDLNTRVDVTCGRKDGRTDWTPISNLAKAGATKIILINPNMIMAAAVGGFPRDPRTSSKQPW